MRSCSLSLTEDVAALDAGAAGAVRHHESAVLVFPGIDICPGGDCRRRRQKRGHDKEKAMGQEVTGLAQPRSQATAARSGTSIGRMDARDDGWGDPGLGGEALLRTSALVNGAWPPHHPFDHRAAFREHGVVVLRVLRPRPRQVGAAASAAADDWRERLDDVAGVEPALEVGRHRGHNRHLPRRRPPRQAHDAST